MPTPNTPREPAPESDPRADISAGGPRLDAADRLSAVYASPMPFVSVFLQTRPLQRDTAHDVDDRWARLRARLVYDGAPPSALEAIDARLGLPMPAESAAVGIVASADGRTAVDYALEPPRRDHGTVDTLPYAAPFIEWDQRRIPHLVVVADDDGVDVVEFQPDRPTRMTSVEGTNAECADRVGGMARRLDCRLIVVGGTRVPAERIADALVPRVAPRCNVVVELDETTDALAESTVRHVSDSAASSTVGFLREFRFLAEHDAAVDGIEATVAALREAQPGVLLIHDDPSDVRRVWIGPGPTDLSVEPVDGWTETGRFVDAAIRAALSCGTSVHVIPSTGDDGPDENVALIRRDTPSLEPV